jgi:hypothetical protein
VKRIAAWPALSGDVPPLAECERGIWGKVHGAPSDFRWIGRSTNFALDRADLPVQLNLGGEDVPARFAAWRSLGNRCYALANYPSRAIDATGRRGFLEKQILEWRRPPEVSAALAALVLLPRVAEFTDEVWWERRGNEFWMEPDACLSIDLENIAADEDAIGITIERGRQRLRETVSPESLARLYDQLLSGRRPALLTGMQQPLSAEALAALLLPLPREIADRLSLAGWIPAERPSPTDLGKRWDVLAVAATHAGAFNSATEAQARRMAEALLSFDPASPSEPIDESHGFTPPPELPEIMIPFARLEKPRLQLQLTAPAPDAPPILRELYAFAKSADRRWLTPRSLKANRPAKLDSSYASLFASWAQELRNQKPPWAHAEQWNVKIDVVRSAAIVLFPDANLLRTIGVPDEDSRVPALLFGPLLGERQLDSLTALGEKGLRQVLTQSARSAAPRSIWRPIREWLVRWQVRTRHSGANIGALIGDALRLRPH